MVVLGASIPHQKEPLLQWECVRGGDPTCLLPPSSRNMAYESSLLMVFMGDLKEKRKKEGEVIGGGKGEVCAANHHHSGWACSVCVCVCEGRRRRVSMCAEGDQVRKEGKKRKW